MPSRSRSTPAVAQRRRQAVITAAAFVVIALVFAITWFINSGSDSGADESVTAGSASSKSSTVRTSAGKTTAATSTTAESTARNTTSETTAPKSSRTRTSTAKTPAPAAAPAHVTRTLALIDAGEWPEAARAPGTKGGITFRNNERRLPATDADGRRVAYREWDVNPKEPGRSRDAERIVTGSDGTAWYTADHYRSFILIRGPS
ncbi:MULTISPECIES: ribonuclease domain-containing protein [Gordonia]|jgi:guanyl-specific ribonuclease Sa|uniref:ribonuclease domain-containing protein n=1 Tax=Gordonia TaxID=2053 RepID=UPI00041AEDCE|nr:MULTISPECIES: ribonuclease domain-containing protein [Gordonia]MDH3007217.1 ribonuclease domain-containing protein [Gordonia alkanivorans]MDH3013467.1 ribonuclease domain-containing protein [Gordonia alkanivorans]MDH3016980.1 ribonuclease domain-containing protein [Gordonia alkanivorans]MDH3022215.1 ribonuclease domain-containing protein [Gordonia alkanivorans]MDH3026120.1 ribonuclease domain-containing protein [Gordonia alkanivorans]